MYDAVFVLVEAFNKLLRKKPDLFRNNFKRGQIFNNGSRGIDCNTSKGWVTPWEHGDKISRFLRKVCNAISNLVCSQICIVKMKFAKHFLQYTFKFSKHHPIIHFCSLFQTFMNTTHHFHHFQKYIDVGNIKNVYIYLSIYNSGYNVL